VNGRSLARKFGRGAVWVTIGLLLVKGVGSVAESHPTPTAAAPAEGPSADEATDAFAVRFARAYLTDPTAEALAPYLAEGARIGTGLAPKVKTSLVAQAEVSGTEERSGGEAVLTVACELRDSRTLYLAVPIVRSEAGEVAALGAPWFVAGPGGAVGVESKRPQLLAGSDGPEIESLVSKFLPTYLASAEASDLSYFLLPGAVVQPLAGQVSLKSLSTITQLGDGEGPRRTVLAAVRVADPVGGATYPLVYRLSVERTGHDDRWYVTAVEGMSA
jgi:hypothetical protein